MSASLNRDEVAKFDQLAQDWWDPQGPMKVLHRFNPVRLAFIRDTICGHYGRNPTGAEPLKALHLLDIGCGGGVLCEPLARLGANVTGIDPAQNNIRIASAHAEAGGLSILYRAQTAEALEGQSFDIVLAMEVVEHVQDVERFIRTCSALVKPGGLMFMATLNRTLRSFALAIVGAEYVLRWLPRGTHDWHKFVTPDELAGCLEAQGLKPQEPVGVVYNPLADLWRASSDTSVNYMLYASKPDL